MDRNLRLKFLVFLMCLAFGNPSFTRPPPPLNVPEYQCPVGGELFKQYENVQTRLDQQRLPIAKAMLSETRYDIDDLFGLPECPTNGLPMYREFSADEILKLERFLLDPEFIKLKRRAPQPIRSFWLATKLGEPALDRLLLILPVGSMALTEAQRKTALEWTAATFSQIPFGYSGQVAAEQETTIAGQISFRMMYVDTLRQLGRFDEALAELKMLPAAQLDGFTPEPIIEKMADGFGGTFEEVANSKFISDRNEDKLLLEDIARMELAIQDKIVEDRPLQLMSDAELAYACSGVKESKLTRQQKRYCQRPGVQSLLTSESEQSELAKKHAQNAVDAAAKAAECSVLDYRFNELDRKPKPLAQQDQQELNGMVADLAGCQAREAVGDLK
jgi:hypothetical protein